MDQSSFLLSTMGSPSAPVRYSPHRAPTGWSAVTAQLAPRLPAAVGSAASEIMMLGSGEFVMLLLRAPHHSSRRMALRYFTLSSSLCAETIGGAWEVRLEKNMERVRAMVSISFYLYEVGSARAPKGFPWWTAGMKIDSKSS